ncbi:MAG: helix-turn-helix transcriptional regulator, partial [Solobacterium sp.]|nr:helix-turn-helix transcriptional regulator [Solobacterium sp.]
TWSSEKSPEYWCGWSLGYYQWYTAHTFRDICSYIRLSEVVDMYNPYHEMDLMQFVDALNRIIPPVDTSTNLSRLRKKAGLSQRMLAYYSGISVRMIQNYEQRRKDINKAQADTVSRLGIALGCDMSALLEDDGARPLK